LKRWISPLFILVSYLAIYSCSSDPSSSDNNTPPIANFTVNPDSGNIFTIFKFDPRGSYDLEDSTTELNMKWDWENDGQWDTDYEPLNIITHQFPTPGNIHVSLEIIDSEGEMDIATHQIVVSGNTLSDSTLNYRYHVVNTYPHDTEAFTQGLIYYNDYLYEGTGLYGQSSLRKVDLESGQVLQQIDISSDYFGEGIAIFENNIYQLTQLSRKGFIYTIDNFDSVGQFTYNAEGWGLTHDGDHFILSDGSSSLQFLDSQHLQVQYSVPVIDEDDPVSNLNELEYINGSIYANIWYSDLIIIINPENGYVTGRIDLSGLLNPEDISPETNVLNGIAYDNKNQRIFVTGKRWPKLFEIELVEVLTKM